MIYIYTGNGKGKTTAALGLGIRAVGQGKNVVMVQFIKGPWRTGEEKAIKFFKGKFDIFKGGLGFVGILGDNKPKEKHEEKANKTWEYAKRAINAGKYDLVILDEINVAIKLRLIKESGVIDFLSNNKIKPDIVLTGRGASKKLIRISDLAADVREIKHPFKKGIKAKRGLEY